MPQGPDPLDFLTQAIREAKAAERQRARKARADITKLERAHRALSPERQKAKAKAS